MGKQECSSCHDQPNVKCTKRMRAHINGLRCGKCNYVKSRDCFFPNRSRTDGYSPQCKDCMATYPPRIRNKNTKKDIEGKLLPKETEEENPMPKEIKRDAKGKPLPKETKWISSGDRMKYSRATLRQFYNYPNQCKRRKKKVEFHLTLDEFHTFTSSPCRYCGQMSRNCDYVGIDRIDSAGDYTVENCAPCCDVCNRMKLDHDVDFFLSHIMKIAANQKTDDVTKSVPV